MDDYPPMTSSGRGRAALTWTLSQMLMLVGFVLLLLSIVTQAQVEKRFSNDYMGLLARYQHQKRFNNDFYGMLGRYQQRPLKRTTDYYNYLQHYQDENFD